ncbi:Crp/Fnr family transcriptional regulator [Mesorhizobium sp. ESP-6-4]|uniref:Crp/Fnr family transcriptional regulator n=1 Tax=Mesorhizobium sp. ESP-6-4 TaxID=2876624 RepID=UPI001CCCF16F|nr:Crp/Fnr family transcriptional regulator [Mesorhizobium sp. ESP-6-4]
MQRLLEETGITEATSARVGLTTRHELVFARPRGQSHHQQAEAAQTALVGHLAKLALGSKAARQNGTLAPDPGSVRNSTRSPNLAHVLSPNVLIRKLQNISHLTQSDIAILEGIPLSKRECRANEDIVREGERPTHSFVVLEGLVGSTKLTGDGKRQITSFFVPGDIPDLHGMHLSVLDCTFSSLARASLGFMRHDAMRAICDRHASIAAIFWRSTLIDAAIYREWVTNVGRRDAYTRMAHILCELIVRLHSMGVIKDHVANLPVTQAALADALGLSTVHVNRVLQELRRNGLIFTEGTRFHAVDWAGLVRAGDFDATYLHQRTAITF